MYPSILLIAIATLHATITPSVLASPLTDAISRIQNSCQLEGPGSIANLTCSNTVRSSRSEFVALTDGLFLQCTGQGEGWKGGYCDREQYVSLSGDCGVDCAD